MLTLVVVDSVEVVKCNDNQNQPHSGGHAIDGIVDECWGGSQHTEDVQPKQHYHHWRKTGRRDRGRGGGVCVAGRGGGNYLFAPS